MKKIVNQLNNCEDIAIIYIAAFYYPELLPSLLSNEGFKNLAPSVGISRDPNHFAKRGVCLTKFTKIWGHNPLVLIGIE